MKAIVSATILAIVAGTAEAGSPFAEAAARDAALEEKINAEQGANPNSMRSIAKQELEAEKKAEEAREAEKNAEKAREAEKGRRLDFPAWNQKPIVTPELARQNQERHQQEQQQQLEQRKHTQRSLEQRKESQQQSQQQFEQQLQQQLGQRQQQQRDLMERSHRPLSETMPMPDFLKARSR